MLDRSNSQIHQDIFVLCVTGGKKNGTYIEVGASHPQKNNNTFILEKDFGWRGISFEWKKDLVAMFNDARSNVCIHADATVADYENIIRVSGLGNTIDYLQLDIEPPRNTLKCLENINLDKLKFAAITFEHDLYSGGQAERLRSREILEGHGYTLVVSDARYDDKAFEDWWVHEDLVPNDNWKEFIGEGVVLNSKSMSSEMREKIVSMLSRFDQT